MNTTASSATPASAPPISTGVRRRSVKIVAREVMMRLDLARFELGRDASERDHIGAFRELERERRFLLDQQDAEPAPVELTQCLEDAGGHFRRKAERGLVEHQQAR